MKKIGSLLFLIPQILFGQVNLISAGSSGWKYRDTGTDPYDFPSSTILEENIWMYPSYNDITPEWKTGKMPFVYEDQISPGCDPLYTCVSWGSNPDDRYVTSYYRKNMVIPDINPVYDYIKLRVKRDDGMVVYLNGQEVFRNNVGKYYLNYNSLANISSPDNWNTWHEIFIDGHILISGNNTLAVELHQSSIGSRDLYLDLELTAYKAGPLSEKEIVAANAEWKYLDNGSNQDTLWRKVGFNDATWSTGNAELGYGDGDETSVLSFGGNPSNKYITTYFRKSFTSIENFDFLKFRVKRDDGVIIYMDSTEIFRDLFISGDKITYNRTTLNANDDGEEWKVILVNGSLMPPGSHSIAAEVHQQSNTSSDLSFNLELIGINNSPVYVDRGPYLMKGSTTGIQIRWQTNIAGNSQVKIGLDPLNLTTSFNNASVTKDHLIDISGLQPNTKYFYSVGSSTQILENSSDNYFITTSTTGENTKVNILTMGDMGSGDKNQRKVMEAFQTFIQDKYIHVFMPLGDIAYHEPNDVRTDGGTMSNFQNNFFQMYQQDRIMKQSPIYPVVGNHEFYNYKNDSIDFTNFNRPYFEVFNMPTSGEEGGILSGTERYYSFNKANIHFIVLDAYGWDSYPTGSPLDTNYHYYNLPFTSPPHASTPPYHAYIWENNNIQKQWLINDLAANNQKWTIIGIHAPIYSGGHHNSDAEWNLKLIRQGLLPIFEEYDVDLVLSGHSHVYERSKLIKGSYGDSTTYSALDYPAGSVVNQSSGKFDSGSSCPYIKNKLNSNKGIVYAVIGTGYEDDLAAEMSNWPHPAMPYHNRDSIGAMLIEIEGNQLNAKWITDDGLIRDKFTIMKDIGLTKDTLIQENSPLNLTASWTLGNYVWSVGGDERTLSPTPPAGQYTTYTVSDSYGCITDTFHVRVVPNCASNSTLSINYDLNPPLDFKFEAGNTIQADKVIKSGTNIKFDAGHSVTINPGFATEPGATFKAYIDGCGNQ